jgi:hypothetical protein
MVIYKTTNKLTGKSYVGKDKYNNPKYLGSGKLLQLSIKKNGRDAFEKVILEETDDVSREQFWVRHLNTFQPAGYNIAAGGEGGDTFTHLTDERKDAKRKALSISTSRNVKQGIGMTGKSVKGKHITESYPEIADKWKRNHKAAMDRVQSRRDNGVKTEGELRAARKIKDFCNTPEERASRSARATGSSNSNYKGPYTYDGIEYTRLCDLPMSYTKAKRLINEGIIL